MEMNKPYIICHMMTSVDGRIDCAMTEQLPGVEEYYATLDELDVPTRISGRYTAELEMASGKFTSETVTPYGKEGFSKAVEANGYEIVIDTKGTLLWGDDTGAIRPHLIITSEDVSQEYLSYLDSCHISWIACGKGHEGLARSMEILANEFGVRRAGVVGGPIINTAFLTAGLLDEISLLVGSGIDGRGGMQAVFDGRAMDQQIIPLQLTSAAQRGNAVWLRYVL